MKMKTLKQIVAVLRFFVLNIYRFLEFLTKRKPLMSKYHNSVDINVI